MSLSVQRKSLPEQLISLLPYSRDPIAITKKIAHLSLRLPPKQGKSLLYRAAQMITKDSSESEATRVKALFMIKETYERIKLREREKCCIGVFCFLLSYL